ncbi:hypothetical protein [Beggiatoa leptomitoformis]|uniref:Uncharacterized protein n=1 Tax=Beggiatoa leptomitoformis TaxID=288004 RepID=A0A650GDQ4_9GAMM|nr:hypothetical protein [Beggiatoa leptomitoformis]QGX03532.1 hypothetical protein AL038_18485 [Beggiatoa leptomitoformis]QGX04046.1 hypothetical protein BLE401_18475 [Beggiatoa leptomitoformis]
MTSTHTQPCRWCDVPTDTQQLHTVKITRSLQNPPPPDSIEEWSLCPRCFEQYEKM